MEFQVSFIEYKTLKHHYNYIICIDYSGIGKFFNLFKHMLENEEPLR